MVDEFSILVRGHVTLEDIAQFIAGFIGHPFEMQVDDVDKVFYTSSFGIQVEVFPMIEGAFEDDSGIEFTRYTVMV